MRKIIICCDGKKIKLSDYCGSNFRIEKTKVINVRVQYIRPEYKNLKAWCDDPNNVYIGRKGIVFVDGVRYPSKDSIWANPYKKGDDALQSEIIPQNTVPHQLSIIELYERYIRKRIKDGHISVESLLNLKGKNLGCWCKEPNKEVPCHGDVLLKLIKEYSD